MINSPNKKVVITTGISLLLIVSGLLVLKFRVGVRQQETSKAFIDRMYQSITGFKIPKEEKVQLKEAGASSTYGEILFDSLKIILDDLQLTDQDVFYDLGSGVGKSVVQVFLTTPVKKAVGIELSPTRCARARQAEQILKKEDKVPLDKEFSLCEGNFLETDLNDATIIYMGSTCYQSELMQAITEKLSAVPAQNNLRIVSLKKLPENTTFELIKEYRLPMTWSKKKGSPVFVYQRT